MGGNLWSDRTGEYKKVLLFPKTSVFFRDSAKPYRSPRFTAGFCAAPARQYSLKPM
jgi:hypothetical protein